MHVAAQRDRERRRVRVAMSSMECVAHGGDTRVPSREREEEQRINERRGGMGDQARVEGGLERKVHID